MGCQDHLFWGCRGVIRRVWCFHRKDQDSWGSCNSSFYVQYILLHPSSSWVVGTWLVCHVSHLLVVWWLAGCLQISIRSLYTKGSVSMINHQFKNTTLGGGSNWSQNMCQIEYLNIFPGYRRNSKHAWNHHLATVHTVSNVTLKPSENKVNTYKSIMSVHIIIYQPAGFPWFHSPKGLSPGDISFKVSTLGVQDTTTHLGGSWPVVKWTRNNSTSTTLQ